MKSRREIKALAKEAIREQRGTAILLAFMVALLTVISVGLDELANWAIGAWAYWIVYTIGLLFLYVFGVNMAGEYIKIFKRELADVGALFTGLKVNFFRKLGGMLWMSLWLMIWALPWVVVYSVLFALFLEGIIGDGAFIGLNLLTLPLLIPSTIKGLSYYMMTYILASAFEVKALESMRLSKRITKGHKGKLFVLGLSFIGWVLLASLPAGIFAGIAEASIILGGGAIPGLVLQVIGYLLSGLIYILFLGPYMSTTYAGYYVELRDKAIEEYKITREELGMEEELAPEEPGPVEKA
ncbi:MAG: DUF975 family protein [Oscillospiraceae bacterium]|nr:DUF975 family protein [Oscillospiraceae bacterium]